MEVDQDRLIDALGSALRYGGPALGEVPELLKRVLRDEVWRDFTTRRGQEVHHRRFADFVTTPPLGGLGSDVALVRRIVADDVEALDLLDEALQNSVGRPEIVDVINEKRPAGTSKGAALRRLRKDAPGLHADVLAGKLTAHAAMVRAGFRPPTFTIRGDDPDSAARAIRKHFTPDQLTTLARLLLAEEG